MLVNLKRMVAYVCPYCSNISSKNFSVFSFSGTQRLNLICPTYNCHEQCAEISVKNDKYKIDIECPLCGESHSYKISRETFWHKPLLTIQCPAADIDIFFLGTRENVERALDESSALYSDFLSGNENEILPVLYAIVERIHNLMDNKKISCSCGSNDIEINIINGTCVLFCRECGRSKVIEANEESLARIINTSKIVLDS